MERLFVYGTLAPGKPNHHILESIPGLWQTATLRGELFEAGWGAELGCPGIIPSKEGKDVDGHLFSSEELSEHWQMLDAFEGEGYNREAVLVKIETGEEIPASVYALNQAKL